VPKTIDETLRPTGPLNTLFAASSILMLLVLGWMTWDDYHRSWKGYQQLFFRLEAEKTRAEIEQARQDVDQNALDDLRSKLEAARATAGQHAAERTAAEDALQTVDNDIYRDDLIYRKFRSTFDAVKFDYEEAAHAGSRAEAALNREMEHLAAEMERYRVILLEHEKRRAGAVEGLKAVTGQIDAAQKQIEQLESGTVLLEKKLGAVAPAGLMKAAIALLNAPLLDFIAPTIRIQQVVLERSPIDINFTRIPRADRCQTCHLAADRADYEGFEQPFRTHPRLDLFAGANSPHPVDRFGCTPCHGGRDRAVEFNYAVHMPDTPVQNADWKTKYDWERDHYWEFPMLERSRTEASCLKCHQGVVTVPKAAHLNRGRQIVERVGCYGCHKMRGFLDRPKVAPRLTRIASKTTPEWTARWLKDPKAFRGSTRMPRFFGLANNQAPGDREREDAEILGIVAYLMAKSEDLAYPPLPGRGDPPRGERLVKSIGCMGCHAIEKDEVSSEVLQARDRRESPDPIAFERRFGPDLSRIGDKARPEWLYQWVRNPRSYNPETRMPDLRLSQQEALDITAYLMTLTEAASGDEPPVAAPQPRPAARDAALLALMSQRQTPADAQATIDAMSGTDRDARLGERTIARYGCFGCHLIPGFEKTPAIGTDLSEEGSKHPDLLFFGFQHQLDHTAPAWFYQKLKSPRSFDEGKVAPFYDRLRMPQFDFTDADAASVTMVLQALTKEKVPLESVRRLTAREEAVEVGRRLVRDYNCQGCHILDGQGGAILESIAFNLEKEGKSEEEAQSLAPSFGPPIIDGEGDKVQPDWLFAFLKSPEPIRPWLAVRMPTFHLTDQEASQLVSHFAAKDKRTFPFETFDRRPPAGGDLKAAMTMFSPDYFDCWNCHQQGARKPQGPPEGWAPDLTLAARRLNPDWISRWIQDPQKLMPGTKMPTFYDPADPKGSAPPDVLGGEPDLQIEALTQYVFTLGQKRAAAMGTQP